MAIKDGKKKNFEKAAQNKVKATTSNQIIIINDSDDDGHSDLPAEVKVKKKKHLVKAKGSDWKDAKKKKKKIDSELKNEACANLHIMESNVDSKSIKKLRKIHEIPKKKRVQRLSCEPSCEVHSEEVSEEQQEGSFLTREAHKRNILSSHGEDNEFTTKKKKKKKRKHKPDCSLVLYSGGNENESKKQISPDPQSVSQETFSKRKWTFFQNADSDTGKKKKVASCLMSMCNHESSNGISDKSIAPGYQLQEIGCKGNALGCKQPQKHTAQEEESKVIKKKKKRAKKQKVTFPFALASKQENHSGASNENLKKAKFKKKLIIGADKSGLTLDSKGARKITKKKKIQAEIVRSHPALLPDGKNVLTNEGESAKKRRKKKIKKSKEAQNGMGKVEDGNFKDGSEQYVKKRKDGEKFQRNSLEEPSSKKARIKLEGKEEEDEIKVVAFKKGNCDEINIDKLRRQALQEEIDRESGKTQVIKEEDESGSCFGQWSTAAFESSERKTKFLRLLGGFKKHSSSTQDSLVPKLNMAVDKSREQNLQLNLQAEFEKAVDLKHHRGIGLGFRPAPQKHVHIDKYASKSIKFEV